VIISTEFVACSDSCSTTWMSRSIPGVSLVWRICRSSTSTASSAGWYGHDATRAHVSPDEQATVRTLGQGVFDVVVRYGFMEDPQHPGGARTRARTRARTGRRRRHVLPWKGDADCQPYARNGDVARAIVRVDGAKRSSSDSVLQASTSTSRGARCSSGDLAMSREPSPGL
jgi:hypothetical protein